MSNDGSRPRRGNQQGGSGRSSSAGGRPGGKPQRSGGPKGRSSDGGERRSGPTRGRSDGPKRSGGGARRDDRNRDDRGRDSRGRDDRGRDGKGRDERRPDRGGPRRDDRGRDERRGDERRRGGGADGTGRDRREDRDLAGPQQWGRIARRGAGNMDYDDPETIAAREERRQRRIDRAQREAEEAEGRPPAREPRERNLPGADDLQRQASRAVARGRGGSSGRERRPLPARPHPVKDPAGVLKKLVGEPRCNTLMRRLNEGAKAFEGERFADARTALAPVVKEAPELPEGRELMGLALYRLGKWKDAIDHLETFREMSGSTEQHPVLADAHRALKHWDDVDELWSELGDASPSAELVVEGRIVVAGAKADQGDITSAIRLLEQGWKPPKKPQGHHLRRAYALADLYDRAGRAPRARDLFSWIQGHAPDLADVRQRVKALS